MKANIPDSQKPRIVIVGGGFGGLETAQKLANSDFQIVLIDRNNYWTFQPLMYQVATAALEPESISYPLRKAFRNADNVFVRMAEVSEIVADSKKIITSIGEISYDYLVIATGASSNYFGNANIEKYAYPMKTLSDALTLRSVIFASLEKAIAADTAEERKSLLHFVVVGGGPTGVELSGSLAELKKDILARDYPGIDISEIKITLIEAISRVLGPMSPVSSENARKFLVNDGVDVRLDTGVADYDGTTIQLDNITWVKDANGRMNMEKAPGGTIISKTLIWAAGVAGQMPAGLPKETIGRQNRLLVDKFCRVKGLNNVFAIGDIALMIDGDKDPQYKNGHPLVATPAIQQARMFAKNISLINQKADDSKLAGFAFFDKGSMAIISRNKAVVDFTRDPFFKFPIYKFWKQSSGFIAWAMWLAVHLVLLLGLRMMVVSAFNWVWAWFTKDRPLRLITHPITPRDCNEEK